MKETPITFKLEEDERYYLKVYCAKENVTMKKALNEAVKFFLENYEAKWVERYPLVYTPDHQIDWETIDWERAMKELIEE